MAGLQLGLRMAGLNSTAVGVRILEKELVNERIIAWEINRTMRLLSKCGCGLRYPKYRCEDIMLLHDFFGEEYAGVTEEGKEAIALGAEKEGLVLDVTYTGKTMAAVMSFIRQNDNAQKNIMFWHTFNSVDLSSFLKDAPDPSALPKKFHCYF